MIDARNLTVSYPGRETPTIADVSFRLEAGELALITGPTGCGKSTLLNCLNGVLIHESPARVSGRIEVARRDVAATSLADLCRVVGSVFQNPDSQICTSTVETEVAFGLENLALDRATMRRRIDEALDFVGLAERRAHLTATLSGGQKQRLAIACALALQPKVLLLDEPISQLDSEGAAEILGVIARLKETHRWSVVIVEHRLDEIVALADRVAVMNEGRLVLNETRDHALADLSLYQTLGLAVPHLPELFSRLGRSERPLDSAEAPLLAPHRQLAVPAKTATPERLIATVRDLQFRYDKRGAMVLDGLDAEFRAGERVALMGANGSGKSTLLGLLAGIYTLTAGDVRWADAPTPRIGLVIQQPDLMLFKETVRDEAAFAPQHLGLDPTACHGIVESVLDRMGLVSVAGDAPFALSRGQRLRTAVASVLSMTPNVLLLDEPTTGQDREQVERMMGGLSEQVELLVFCTHDVDTAARHASRVILLEGGRIIADGPTRAVLFDYDRLRRARIRPTSAQLYAERLGLRALQVDELVEALS